MDSAGKLTRFEQLVLPHLNAAYNLSRWLMRNHQDAEDLAQQSCLKAFRSFETFRGNDSEEARTWLLTVVRNTCFTWLRKRGEKMLAEFDEQMHTPVNVDGGAEATLLDEADLRALRGCIEALPVEFRETVVLRELEELSYKEISAIVRVPQGTVMSRLARARKRLQDCMGTAR